MDMPQAVAGGRVLDTESHRGNNNVFDVRASFGALGSVPSKSGRTHTHLRRMELLVAANKIREKWRGRSRRAKDELAFKKATLELASDWSSHFEDLLRGRVPPVLKFDAINIHAGLAWRKVSWAPGRWLCVHYAVPHDTHTPYIYILSLCAQGLYKMCIDSFTEPLLDRFSSPRKHQHRAKT